MTVNVKVSASLEDYLEAIYHTVEAKGAARAKDIVVRMGVHNSSVTQALKSLSEKELVNYAPYDTITLTPAGQRIAADVVHRHSTLRAFLSKVLGMEAKKADEGACRLEHAVSGEVVDRLVKFVKYFETCPAADIRWDEKAGYFCGSPDHEHDGSCGRDVCGGGLDLPLRDLSDNKTDTKEN
jgi:DtxR family Mn-dependent transcriptional regulator